MPKKDKKSVKKSQKEVKDQLSAVDKTYFEITINDLNTKLTNLRKRNGDIEEQNVGLETKIAQLDEDRADIISFLDRTVNKQTSNIKVLEEKLSELAKVRSQETERFQNIIKDWESKYKAMHEQLSSEIKLLAGKLNYLEEFRLQHDDLMAKFDQQDRNLKEQEQRHKDTLYELEHKQITEKIGLKNQLESRLLELSNEFAKTNQIRTAAHVQRMTRENIALNNEIDRLLYTVEDLRKQNKSIKLQKNKQHQFSESVSDENAQLSDMCKKYLKIIQRLTTECEKQKIDGNKFSELDKMRRMAEVRETSSRKELNEFKSKFTSLKSELNKQMKTCEQHRESDTRHRNEIVRLLGALSRLKNKINVAISSDSEQEYEMQRKQLLDELLRILTTIKEVDDVSIDESIEMADEMTPLNQKQYQKGKIGITPRKSVGNMIKYTQTSFKGRRKSLFDAQQMPTKEIMDKRPSLIGCAIIDVSDNAMRMESTDSIRLDDDASDEQQKSLTSRKKSMIQMSRDSNDDDDDDNRHDNK